MKILIEKLPEIIGVASKSKLGIFALMILCIAGLATYWFSTSPIIIRIGIFILILIGAAMYGISVTRSYSPKIETNPQIEIVNAAYGLKIKKNVWKHHYLANYDFEGEIEYLVENISEGNLTKLIPVKANWFGSDVILELDSKIYGDANNKYNLVIDDLFKKSEKINEIDGKEENLMKYDVHIKINPPLGPKEILDYGIRFKTLNTEKDAFNLEKGSWAGMGSLFPVDILECEIYAPKGYKFIDKGHQVIDQAGRKIKIEDTPQFSGDEKKITWVIKNPSPALRYLVKIFIVKIN